MMDDDFASPAGLATLRVIAHCFECVLGLKPEDLGDGNDASPEDLDFISSYVAAHRRREAAQAEIEALEASRKPISRGVA